MPLSNAGSKKIRSYDPVYPGMLIGALTAYRRGDFAARLPGDLGGVDGEIAEAKGDLTQTMDLEPDGQRRKGAFLNTAKTVNAMVERLGSFASEVTRVSWEVGIEGKLGAQANVPGAADMPIEETPHQRAGAAGDGGAIQR